MWLELFAHFSKRLNPVGVIRNYLKKQTTPWKHSTSSSLNITMTHSMQLGKCIIVNYAIVSIDFEYNVASHSPLFEATRSQDLDAVIMLISYGADVNCKDENGFPPLHHAIELNFPFIAKTLIVFGADHKLVKIKGKSVQQYCVNQAKLSRKRSRFVKSGMFHVLKVASVPSTSNVKPSMQYERQLLRPTTTNVKKTHLLSLDGGGIRGLVLTTIMDEIEKTIPDFFEKFKFVAGTSTGSILALAMCQGKSIAKCRNIYFKFKDFVFTKGKGINYDEKILEEFLQKTYVEDGNEMTMYQLGEMSDKNIISTSVDQTNAFLEAAHFKSYKLDANFHQTFRDNNPNVETGSQDTLNDAPDCFATCTDDEGKEQDDIEEPTICVRIQEMCNEVSVMTGIGRAKPREQMKMNRDPQIARVHAVARCTSAAPSYFHSAEDGKYVDGGVLNNNPSMVLLNEFLAWNNAQKRKKEALRKDDGDELKLGAVVSIGTGKEKPKANTNDQCPCRPSGRGGCYDICHLAEMVCKLKGEIGKSDGEVVQQSDTLTKSQDGAFFRFQPIFKEEILLDETDNQTLIEMMWDTKVYMRRQTNYIEILKKIIEQKINEDYLRKSERLHTLPLYLKPISYCWVWDTFDK
ncbi:hypothetical protein PRIPAC_85619 [Pristionchus pacificus]|nr:hypothetical protein PRIPAC_85619 [Pristionchus pacificus]